MTSPVVNSSPISEVISTFPSHLNLGIGLTLLQLDDHVTLHIVTGTLIEQEPLGELGRVERLEDVLVSRKADQGDDLVELGVEGVFCTRSLAAAHDRVKVLG